MVGGLQEYFALFCKGRIARRLAPGVERHPLSFSIYLPASGRPLLTWGRCMHGLPFTCARVAPPSVVVTAVALARC